MATDVNRDGLIDLFTGNRSGDLNLLYLNTGGGFSDITVAAGINLVGFGMGVLSFDYDNDLDFDLYWTTWPDAGTVDPDPNGLYRNVDGISFVEVAVATGTDDPDGWGISCNAGDVDNDGWEDFFVTNGFSATTTPNVLFRNNGGVSFSDVTATLGGGDFDGRGAAFADFDNDGDLDLCVTAGASAPTRLWRNDTNNGNHWLTVKLEGTVSNRSGIGARIEVTTDLRTTAKEVSGGAGRGSQNSLPVEFGLGNATAIEQIQIFWPSGIVQTVCNPSMDQVVSLVETSGTLPCEAIVPTLSEWGLMTMAAVLLTAGAWAIARRRRTCTAR